jgi:hypothetical protein
LDNHRLREEKMEEKDKILIEMLEELNKEYLYSNDYVRGKFFNYLLNLFKNRKFINFFKLILLNFSNKIRKNNKLKLEELKVDKKTPLKYTVKSDNNQKIAIYTCITGNYDNVEEPVLLESNCDYFLFTNNKNIKSLNWKIKEIPENILELNNNAKINRYIKMHPKELFEDYDYAIYIDGNIKLISIISSFISNINEKTGLAIHRHCSNNCIYDEIKSCGAYGKGNYSKLKKQKNRYKKAGFPEQYGMVECNVLVSDLKNYESVKIFDEWWSEYMNSESMRDQIALPYVLWKNNIKICDIGNLGNNVNQNCKFKINTHL